MKNFLQKFSLSLLFLMTATIMGFSQNTLFFEGFESGGFTQNAWTQEPTNAQVPWSIGASGVGTITPYAGTKMVKLFSSSYQKPVKLITKTINLTNVTDPYISFFLSSERFNVGMRDTLKLYYKALPSGSWTVMRIYTQSSDSWAQEVLRIKDFTQENELQFAFEYCYSNGKGLALDNIKVYSQTVCFAPVDLKVQNISTTSGVFRWISSAYAQSNDIKVSTTPIASANLNTATGNVLDQTTTLSIVNLTNLAPNTPYYCYVRSKCGAADISEWAAITFKTRCNPVPEANVSDLIEGFETYPNNGYPDCWLRARDLIGNWTDITIGTGDYFPFVQTSVFRSGTKSLKISGHYERGASSGLNRYAKSFAIANGLDVQNINQYYVSFWTTSDQTTNKLHVGTMTDPDDITTFQDAKIVSVEKVDTWEKINVYFNNVTNNGKYIAFVVTGQDGNTSNTFFIDDVQVIKTPTCPSPDRFKHLTTTRQGVTYSAVFKWDMLYTTQTSDIYFYTEPSDPATTTPVKQATGLLPPANIQGFSTLTTYYAYIKNSCGNTWIGPVVFTTPLAAVPIPYTDDFETQSNWLLSNGEEANKWVIGTARPYKGTKSLYISNDNGAHNLYTPTANSMVYAHKKFDFNAGQKVEFSFYWRNFGNNDNAFLDAYLVPETAINEVQPGGIPFSTWIKLTQKSLSRDTVWSQFMTVSDIPTTGVYSLVFHWYNSTSVNTSDFNPPIAIDNVEIRLLKCKTAEDLKVEDVTQSSAKVTWTNPVGGATQWLLWCRPISTPDTTGIAPISVSGNSYQLTGLSSFTTYRVYLVGNCGGANGKSYAKTLNFQTHQGQEPLPYIEDFEGTNTFRLENGNQRNKWFIGTADKATGTKSMYISYAANTRRYMVSGTPDPTSYVYAYKTFEFLNNEVYTCSFDYKSYGEKDKDIINVFVVPDYIHDEALFAGNSNGMAGDNNNPPPGWIRIGNNPIFNSSNVSVWKQFANAFAVPISGRYKIVFMWKNNSSGGLQMGAGAIDNLKVEKKECSAPYTVDIQGVGTSVVVNWLASSSATSWDVSWGTDTNNLSAPVNVTTPTFTANGLSTAADIVYYFRIKSNCGGGLTDVTTHQYRTVTQFPYFTGFETDADTLWRMSHLNAGNKWRIGSERNAVRSGVKAMYIVSPSAYQNYDYVNNTTAAYAFRSFLMKQGARYKMSFYWKAKGNDNDYMQVFLVPIADKGLFANGSTPSTLTKTQIPPGWIDLLGGQKFNNDTWKKEALDFISTVDGVYFLVFYWTNNNWTKDNPPVSIDDLEFYPFTCEMVKDITVDNITINGATITWRSNNVPSYDVKVSTTQINPEVSTADIANENVTDTTLLLNGLLTAGTTYYVYVRANCSATNNSYYNVTPIVFGTACNAQPIPYTADFNSNMLDVMPNCWMSAVLSEPAFTGNYTPFVARLTGDPNQRYLRFDTYFNETIGSTKSFAMLPKFNLPFNQLQISFDAIGPATGKIILVAMADNDPSSITILKHSGLLPEGKHHVAVLDGVPATTQYIAFMARGDENGIGTVGIDNVKLETANMCQTVSDIKHKNIGTNTAELYWDSPYVGTQNWHVVVTTVNISGNMDQLATLPASQVIYNQNVQANNVILQNLSPGTKYFYYIRKVCTGNTYSSWFNENRMFITNCLSSQKCTIEIVKKSATGNGWGINTKLEVKLEGNTLHTITFGNEAHSESQTLQLCPNIYNLKFTKTTFTRDVFFKIVVNGDTVFSVTPNSNELETYNIEILSNCSLITCNAAANINLINTTNSINATWTGTSSSYKARLYEGDISYSDFETEIYLQEENITATNVTFSSLISNKEYTIFIKSSCVTAQSNLESQWVRVATRTLMDIPSELPPINTNFETDSDNAKWLNYSNNTPNRWIVGTAVNNGAGTKSLYISKDNGVTNNYQVDSVSYSYATRYLDLTGGKDYHVTFNWKADGESKYDIIRAFLIPGSYGDITVGNPYGMTAGNNIVPSDWIAISKPLYGRSTAWGSIDTTIYIANTNKYFLAFFWKNDGAGGAQPPAAIDNVEFYEELCTQPVNINISNVSSNIATVSWTGSAVSYDVKVYKITTAVIDPNTTTPQLQSLAQTALTYNITGLSTNTEYAVYIRANCTGGTHSGWKKTTFSTDFNLDNLPLNTGFEDDTDNAKWIVKAASSENSWYFGSALNEGATGTKAMYISNNNGTTNAYNYSNANIAYALRAFKLNKASMYKISFKWKCKGEVNRDLGRVFLVPSSYKQSIVNADANGMNYGSNDKPTGWIDLGGNDPENLLQQTLSWQTVAKEFNIPSDGIYYLTFFWKNDASSGSQPPIAIDNLIFDSVPCPNPTNFNIVSTTTTATVSWTSIGNSFDVKLYNMSGTSPILINQQTTTAPNVSYTGLIPANKYNVVVKADCGNGFSSNEVEYSFVAINSIDKLPINGNLEMTVDNLQWKFSFNPEGVNKWHIGTAAKKNGSRGLYISYAPSGAVNSYADNSKSFAYAYRKVRLEADTIYAYTFSWKAAGEGAYDLLRAFAIPTTANITDGNDNGMSSNYNTNPEGWIDLNTKSSGGKLQKIPAIAWNTVENLSFKVTTTAEYYLAFLWKNDASAGTQPPAAIDDFAFSTIKTKSVSDTICVGYDYTRNNFNISKDSLKFLGSYTFRRLHVDQNTGQITKMTLALNVIPGTERIEHRTVCSGDTINFYGRVIVAQKDQRYNHYTVGKNGCDSIEILDLKVLPSYNLIKDTTVNNCDLPQTINGRLFNRYYPSGTWVVSQRHNATGNCDSIITYAVTIEGVCNSLLMTEAKNLKFVPNPIKAGDPLVITGNLTHEELAGLKVEVITATGDIIKSVNANELPIQIDGFNVRGIYIVRIITGKGDVIYGKIIVR